MRFCYLAAVLRRFAFVLIALPLPGLAQTMPAGETVRACPHYGAGFYQIPGSSTCIRIGGRVATEFTATSRRADRVPASGFGASARVSADTRTDTDYGPLRSYVRLRARSGTGSER